MQSSQILQHWTLEGQCVAHCQCRLHAQTAGVFATGGVKGVKPSAKAHGLVPLGKPLHFTPSPSLEHLRQVSEGDLASLDGTLDPEHSTINVRRPLLPK